MENVKAIIKGLYNLDEISLNEVSKVVKSYIEDNSELPTMIFMCKEDAMILADLCGGLTISIAVPNWPPTNSIKMDIRLDRDKPKNKVYLL